MAMLLAGRYRLGEQLGAGGSSKVFRAHDERLGRDVAVKVLDESVAESADPAARQRFETESRLAATFVHPNAVTIFDAGSAHGFLFLVMELLPGGTLAQRLARLGPMDPAMVRRLGVQIGGALAAGHAAGIIHRDVKPSNILLGDDGTAKLADFGIARRFDEVEQSLTSTGMVMGTRSYVSPEQASGLTLTPATDVFSLGVTLFEAVTGTRPRSATERPAGDVIDPRQVVPGIDPDLAGVISTACAVEIENRHPSMAAMVQSLESGSDPSGSMADDGTATMPARLRPDPGSARFTPTATSAEVPPVPTPPARPASSMMGGLGAERRRRRLVVALATVSAVLIGLVGFAWARSNDDPGDNGATGSVSVPLTSTDPDTSTASAATSTAAATTTIAPTTTAPPPTTSAVTASAPESSAPSAPAAFLATLSSDPDAAGRRGDELVRELRKIFEDEDGKDRSAQAARLQDKIDKWLDKDEIDPVIARTALTILDGVAEPADGT